MVKKIDRKWIEEHIDELAEEALLSQASDEEHEQLCESIRVGEIQGEVYEDGSAFLYK